MKRVISTAAVFLCLIGMGTDIPAIDLSDVRDGDWVQHFNGKDLENWIFKFNHYDFNVNPETITGKEAITVEDGYIKMDMNGTDISQIGQGVFAYDDVFTHYIYGVEFRFVPPIKAAPGWAGWADGNNGVLFHCQELRTMRKDQGLPATFEAQLHSGRTGDLYLLNGTSRTDDYIFVPPEECRSVTGGGCPRLHALEHEMNDTGWNRFEVQVLGDSLAWHIMEKDTVLKYGGLSRSSGHVCLQSEGQTTWFRKAEILNLVGCMDETSPSYRSYFVKDDPSSCAPPIEGCMDSAYLEYDPDVTVSADGACITPGVAGCMDPDYVEYNPEANVEPEGACVTGLIEPNWSAGSLSLSELSFRVNGPGFHRVRVIDAQGTMLFSHSGIGVQAYVLTVLKSGVCFITVETESGTVSRKTAVIGQ